MAKDWEYAKATKWISEHGGTQKAFEIVKNYYMKKGFKEGAASKNPVIALTGVVCLVVGVAGKCVYDIIREKNMSEDKLEAAEQAKVKKAEGELMTFMKQNIKAETEVISELKDNSPELTSKQEK